MITGAVNQDREAIISIRVIGPLGDRVTLDGLIDTGFDGWVTLPEHVISSLKLPWRRRGRAALADGSEHLFDIYEGTIDWDGQLRRIPVDSVATIPLVGMALLQRQELRIQVRSGGAVTINRLP